MFGEGISRLGEIIDYGVKLDIIDKSGAWFSYQDKKLAQGKENSKIFLKENPKIADEIEAKIKEQIGANDEIIEFVDENADDSSDDEK